MFFGSFNLREPAYYTLCVSGAVNTQRFVCHILFYFLSFLHSFKPRFLALRKDVVNRCLEFKWNKDHKRQPEFKWNKDHKRQPEFKWNKDNKRQPKKTTGL